MGWVELIPSISENVEEVEAMSVAARNEKHSGTLDNSLTVFHTAKYKLYIPETSLPPLYLHEEKIYAPQNLNVNAHNCQTLETVQLFINR